LAQKLQHGPTGRDRLAAEFGDKPAQEGEVFRRVQRPALSRFARNRVDQRFDFKAGAVGANEGGDVLALGRARGLSVGDQQRFAGESFAVKPIRPSGGIDIGGVIGPCGFQQAQNHSRDGWVQQRTVGGKAHDDIRPVLAGSIGEAAQNVLLGATINRNAGFFGPGDNRIVRRFGGGGNSHPIDTRNGLGRAHHPGQNRAVAQGFQHFAGQARGLLTGLNERESRHRGNGHEEASSRKTAKPFSGHAILT
jgi:hypothetical protein